MGKHKADFVTGLDCYVQELKRYEERMTEAASAKIDGWHRLAVRIENGTIMCVELTCQETRTQNAP